jgi:hypothetical protein
MEKHIIHQLFENCLRFANGHDVTDLKSMEGFKPCHPICFHCFDIIPNKVRPRNAKCQRALGASYNEYLVVRKLHIQNLKLSLTFKRQPCIPSALHETHQIAYLNTVANFLVFLHASTFVICQICCSLHDVQ